MQVKNTPIFMRSLTQLRKNQRADKTKSGRKAPRKFDLIQIHELNTEEQSEEIQLTLDSSLPLLPKSTVDDAINAVVAQAEPEENATIDPIDVNVGVGQVDEKLWCVCNKPADGDMIGCDNSECKTEWFHFECVKIRKVPKGDWFCKDCRSGNSATRKITFEDENQTKPKRQKKNIKKVKGPECENLLAPSYLKTHVKKFCLGIKNSELKSK